MQMKLYTVELYYRLYNVFLFQIIMAPGYIWTRQKLYQSMKFIYYNIFLLI